MAIIDNRVTEDGDVLIIKPEVPVVGLISLYNFIDTIVGETQNDYFLKEFRYSVNGGVSFSEWAELTVENLQSVSVSKEHQFVIEYRYTRIGGTPGEELEFEDILVSGDRETLDYPIYDSTYFNDFFSPININIYGWALNVLEKLYMTGILPKYVQREVNKNNPLSDIDFISFWNTITHFFAIIVYFARQFRDIKSRENLLLEFLKNRDIIMSNADYAELLSMFEDYISTISQRGTYDSVDNELKNLIGYGGEEFLFSHLKPEEIGWCIGMSSPVWNNTEKMVNMIKGYEFTSEVVDLSKYPLRNPQYIDIVDEWMRVTGVPLGHSSGVAYDSDESKRILVDKAIGYEVSFFCKTPSTSVLFSFSLDCMDKDGNSESLRDVTSNSQSNVFFSNKSLDRADTLYHIRGIIYDELYRVDNDGVFSTDPKAVFYPEGHHLKFGVGSDIRYIVPKILLNSSSSSDTLYLSNIKIRPLKLNYTRGQLGMKNIINLILKNGSELSDASLRNRIRETMIPLNSFLKTRIYE